jgi:hypothetical protein
VTEAIGNWRQVLGYFVSPDATKPLKLLGYADPLYSYNLVEIELPDSPGALGTVGVLEPLMGEAPAWIERGLPGCMLAWNYVLSSQMGSEAINVTEALQCVDPSTHKPTVLWSQDSQAMQGSVKPAFFGPERAIDLDSGILFTQSEKMGMGTFDLHSNKTLGRLAKTAGTRLVCLHYDAVEQRLGGIVQAVSPGKNSQVSGLEVLQFARIYAIPDSFLSLASLGTQPPARCH